MLTKKDAFDLKRFVAAIDWKLLIFLLLFLNIKMPVKVLAIIFIYLFQFDFKFGFSFKNSRLPLFYLLIIPIACLSLIVNKNYQNTNYLLVFITGIGFWLLSILSIHQIKLMVERGKTETIHQTIIVFFMINAMVTIGNIAAIVWQIHDINPYTYRGLYQTYYLNTGDFIKGVSFDISTTNAVINAAGVIYFLIKKNPLMLFLCMVALLLTCCNLITMLLLLIMLLLVIFKSTSDQKSMIVVCFMLVVVFMVKISPSNKKYVIGTIDYTLHQQPGNGLANDGIIEPKHNNISPGEEKKQRIAIAYLDSVRALAGYKQRSKQISWADPDSKTLARKDSETIYLSVKPTPDQKILLNFIDSNRLNMPLSAQKGEDHVPGKIIGIIQTILYLYHNPVEIVAGTGIGNFSSKIAFRATGLGLRGGYPVNSAYINPAFLANHLDLYMNFFSRTAGFRSVKNNPFSVYDQLLSEYGVLGLSALLIYYFGFFVRDYKELTYGIPLLLFMAGIFFMDYWFEQLSVMVLFELMLFLNIKETETLITV